MTKSILKNAIIGKLNREFIIPLSGKPVIDGLGGNLLYAACGHALWGGESGLVSKVSEDYPREWLEKIRNFGFDISGIETLSGSLDHRFFCAYQDSEEQLLDSPLSQFARIDQPFPNALLGYSPLAVNLDSRSAPTPFTIRQSDIPNEYLDVTAVHLCPIDFLTHALIPVALRQGNISTITIDPSDSYMSPTFWDEIPSLVKNTTGFLTSEKKLRSLFKGQTADLWEMAEAIASYGCEIIVIKRRSKGQYIYDHSSKNRWAVPAYPARVVNPLGAGDAFCGGFLFGYTKTYDPLEAGLYGNISASMVIEGSGPFFALDSLPGLAQVRLDTLRDQIVKVS